MAPNGVTSRKTPAPAPPKAAKGDDIVLEGLFDIFSSAARPKLRDDVKENLPVLEKPGSWDSKTLGAATPHAPDRPLPNMNKIPPALAKAFPRGKLMADQPNVLKCTHCKRPVLKHAMPAHIERCLNKKQEKLRKKKEAKDARDAAARKERNPGDASDEEVEVDGGSTKKTAAGKGGLTASKKRKAGDENAEEAGPAKKKKKKDAADKLKAPKAKVPVDVEKQCGVELPQGGQCARSLTCKSHSMGAKRAVPGRSAPYDKLLMEYQRKNQAKLQKAAFDANAPADFDDEKDMGPVDSEEEKEAVMSAIARSWGGQPIYQPQPVPLRRKYEFNRFKSMLASALPGRVGGGGGGGFFGNTGGGGGGFFGPAPVVVAAPVVEAEGGVLARKGSVVPGARSMMAPSASRQKGSLAP
ncbi:hypothetical protein LTR08_005152 [Meristemomyces frigidus]|nr:hypothetical protein LTR08_005152 [Meristemomyces frigidus]